MLSYNWGHAIPGCAGTFDDATLEELLRSPNVKSIEEDGELELCKGKLVVQTQQNAPWGLQRISQRPKVPDDGDLNLVYTFTYNKQSEWPGPPVDIYILDTGIRTTHHDFGGRARWGKTFAGTDGVDVDGHGTHCAGIAGGTQFGVAKDAGLVAVKVVSDSGESRWSDLISGLDWVAQDAQSTGKAAVASISLGGSPSQTLDDAVNTLAITYGIHVVVAASNYNADASNYSPARAAEAITVGASDISDARESHSNFGPAVAIFAPGKNILSAGIEDDDGITRGGRTSAAAPHVAGIVAYWINVYNNLPPRAMKEVLRLVATRGALSDLPAGTPNLLANNNSDDQVKIDEYDSK